MPNKSSSSTHDRGCPAWLVIALFASACGSSPASSATDAGHGHEGGVDASDGAQCETSSCTPGADASMDAPKEADVSVPEASTGTPCVPFVMPSAATLFGSKKKVFAHYFYPFPLSIDNKPAASDYYNTQYLTTTGESDKWIAQGGYLRSRPLSVPVDTTDETFQLDNMEREVKMAMAAGITGFTVDVLGANQVTMGTQLQNLLLAAAAVDSRFKIVVMPDLSALAQSGDAGASAEATVVESIITSVASSPAAYRLPAPDNRLVVSAFAAEDQPASWWASVFSDLSKSGIDAAFVPVFLGWEGNATAFASTSYGFSDWGTATPSASMASQAWPAEAHTDGKIFMMPVGPQQYRPKDFIFWEAENSAAFRDAWTSAIAGGSDWVQLVTWSDFSESSEIEPYTDATLSGEIGTGYYDLNAYYASWFLTGAAPVITSDVLYYFYRREPTTAAASAQAQPTTAVNGGAMDDIELLAFLTTPGTIQITINGQTFSKDAPAGVTSFVTPLQAGTPTFTLMRAETKVFSFEGGVSIVGAAGQPSGVLDLTYWSGSASKDGTCTLTVP